MTNTANRPVWLVTLKTNETSVNTLFQQQVYDYQLYLLYSFCVFVTMASFKKHCIYFS